MFAVYLSVLPNTAAAQTPADISAAERQAEFLQRQEQERLDREREEALKRAKEPKGIDTESFQPEIKVPDIGAVCREIKSIVIEGAPNLSESVRERITETFAGRCLGVSDIEKILGIITKDYIDRGFITTRAYLPPQDLSTGVLTILVIEGVVEGISIDDGGSGSVSVFHVFPGIEGELLNLRDLEQGIDQLNRLGSNDARLDIRPGTVAGASEVLIHNRPVSPYHFGISADNQGSKSTGKIQTGVSAGMDNLFGLNDMLSVTHRMATPSHRKRQSSRSDTLFYSVPYGYNTLSLGGSYSKYESTLFVPSGAQLLSSGNNRNGYLTLDRVIYRDQATRASVSGTLTVKDARNYLENVLLEVSSRRLSVFDLDGRVSTGFGGGIVNFSLGYSRGLRAFGALKDQENLPEWAPHAQFDKFRATMGYMRPFRIAEQSASFSSQFSGQRSNDTLYGSEQIYIGGIYSVRGFEENSLSGDHGYYWRNELSLNKAFAFAGENISARFYGAYDFGWVKNRAPGIPEGRLAGAALGVSAYWRGASFELYGCRGLSMPSSMNRERNQVWFRLGYAL